MHWQGPAAPGPPSGVRCLLMAFPFICFDWKAYQRGRQLPRTMLPQPLQLIQAPSAAAAAAAGFRATSHTFQPAASCLLLPCSFHIVLIFYCCEPHVPVLLRCMDLIDVGEGKVPKHTVNNVEKTLANLNQLHHLGRFVNLESVTKPIIDKYMPIFRGNIMKNQFSHTWQWTSQASSTSTSCTVLLRFWRIVRVQAQLYCSTCSKTTSSRLAAYKSTWMDSHHHGLLLSSKSSALLPLPCVGRGPVFHS